MDSTKLNEILFGVEDIWIDFVCLQATFKKSGS